MTLKLDPRLLYEIMSEFHTLGDEEYGGQGTFQEAILVGYIYGLLTENPMSQLTMDSTDRKVYRFGGYNYIIWFDEVYAKDTTEETEEPHFTPDTFEVRIEDLNEDFDEDFDEDSVLLPVAVEGPYSEEDIREFLSNGDL
jgi:hypothetical protein